MWFVLVGIVVILLFYWKFVLPLYYWDNRKVPNVRGWPIIGKQARFLFRQVGIADWFKECYNEFPNEKFSGSHQFNQPILVIRDPDLVKDFYVKAFDHFPNRISIVTKEMDPLFGSTLLFRHDQEWKSMRSTLSPAFTSSKMKMMYQLISNCAEEFCSHFHKKSGNITAINTKEVVSRFTTDVIASCAFGAECNSLVDKNNEFYKMGSQSFEFRRERLMKVAMFKKFPTLMKFLNITVFPKSVHNFFLNLVSETIRQREQNGIIRPDMIHLLMEAKKGKLKYDQAAELKKDTGFATVEEHSIDNKSATTNISDTDIAAQCLFFFVAGFEPVSTSICFILHELALNIDIQARLRNEIDDGHNGKFTYESIMGMKYLDMVVTETLRKWPPVPVIQRACSKAMSIPRDNLPDLVLTKGAAIVVPTIGIHHDEQYYPNPDKFDPERFNDENKDTINPYTYLPFGQGPRNCIGSRFALLEIKIFVAHLIRNFELLVIEKTPIPIKLDTSKVVLSPQGGFWVGFKSRKHD